MPILIFLHDDLHLHTHWLKRPDHAYLRVDLQADQTWKRTAFRRRSSTQSRHVPSSCICIDCVIFICERVSLHDLTHRSLEKK